MFNSQQQLIIQLEQINMNTKERIQKLSNISSAKGLIMRTAENSFGPIKLAYDPYLVTKQGYLQMGIISSTWQKLLYEASKDDELIKKTFFEVAKIDEMIQKIYNIYLKSCQDKKNDSLCLARIDYFKNKTDQFKIIQYNLVSVSMASHSQNFALSKKLMEETYQSDKKHQYPKNSPASDIAEAVCQLYRLKNLNGTFLMIVSSKQKNIVDQTYLQIKLMQKGIKTKRQNLCCLYYKIQIRQNKLFYQNQEVSVVYYRTGYQPHDYCQNGKYKECWQAKQRIQLSSAIKIPDIKMQLINQKRMQVQLSKQSVYMKYLTQQQANMLKKSLVFTIDFEENQRQIDWVKYVEQKGTDKFILKPNLQGGGNNIYGQKAYEMLKTASRQELKKYILMQKIQTDPVQNQIFMGQIHSNVKCICQLSRYGILLQVDGKLIQNSSDGYLIRVKPQNVDQGGVMAGVGAICTMAFQK